DRSQMTMKDLLYWVPRNNPMLSSGKDTASVPSIPCAPASSDPPAEVSPAAEAAPSLSSAGDAQSLLVPQVRVAEDGSIVLNEDRIAYPPRRPTGHPLVQVSSSSRGHNGTQTHNSSVPDHVVVVVVCAETELFFLAISMVGMDFSMIGQLFPNRSRVDIKNKFKREERCNPRKIDQAFRNKLPLDVSCFETLLQE
uniref:Transcription factor TFIIIB component B'' Myb domain-containing protein n=1 Tax=Petromyzon marinus TaxID=7757 RepID=S4RPG0_PETMA